nr:nicotinamide phosphoribosyltransferase domain-containing protein [Candidatus Gracilibacteria bacterium]
MKTPDYKQFPEISFAEFQAIPYLDERIEIAKRNKILRTDAYNRTMDYIKGDRGNGNEVFYLSLRKSPNSKFNVIYGIRNIVDEVLRTPVSQSEIDFAKDFYEYQASKGGNGKFNPERWQKVVDEHNGMLPIKVSGVADGTILKPGEPALRVEGEAEIAAIFEPIFMRLFYQSVVATNARIIEEIISEGRIVEFGYRSAINDDMHIKAMEALVVGGGISRTSSDVTAATLDIYADGTTAHRFFTAYPTEDEAMQEAVEKNDKIALLVDSVEAYAGIDKIIALKKKYPGKIIAPRLDSGDLANQAVYALQKMKENSMLNPMTNKIVVADISTIEDIVEVELAVTEAGFNPKDYIVYGLGGLLIAREKTRDIVSAGYKLSATENGGTMKFSNDKGKQSIPGKPNVEIRNGKRYIVQEDEEQIGVRLLTPMYDMGQFFYDKPKVTDMYEARETMRDSRKWADYESKISEETKRLIDEIKEKVGIDV